ncbi:MAG: hypothetical protein ACFCBV_05840 [Phycisphaerales bacterium]
MAVHVTTRTLGSRREATGFEVPPPPDAHDDGSMVLRDLIEHVVRQQVRLFNARQADRRFDRVLTEPQIREGREKGKVDPAAKEDPTEANAEEAVGAALQAFEDGMYLVIIDEVEKRSLDEPVYLSSNSRLVFVRLTFLAGA